MMKLRCKAAVLKTLQLALRHQRLQATISRQSSNGSNMKKSVLLGRFSCLCNECSRSHRGSSCCVVSSPYAISVPSAFASTSSTGSGDVALARPQSFASGYGRRALTRFQRVLDKLRLRWNRSRCVGIDEFVECLQSIASEEYIPASDWDFLFMACGKSMPTESASVKADLLSRILRELEQRNLLDIHHINALLMTYLEINYSFSPVNMLKYLANQNLSPNQTTIQFLLSRYCESGDMDAAISLVELQRKQGSPVSAAAWASLVAGFLKQNKVDEAKRTLNRMKVDGFEPNYETYMAIARGSACAGNFVLLEQALINARKYRSRIGIQSLFDLIVCLAPVDADCVHIEKLIYDSNLSLAQFKFLRRAVQTMLRLITDGFADAAFTILLILPKNALIEEGMYLETFNAFFLQLFRMNTDLKTASRFATILCSQVDGNLMRAIASAMTTLDHNDDYLQWFKRLRPVEVSTPAKYQPAAEKQSNGSLSNNCVGLVANAVFDNAVNVLLKQDRTVDAVALLKLRLQSGHRISKSSSANVCLSLVAANDLDSLEELRRFLPAAVDQYLPSLNGLIEHASRPSTSQQEAFGTSRWAMKKPAAALHSSSAPVAQRRLSIEEESFRCHHDQTFVQRRKKALSSLEFWIQDSLRDRTVEAEMILQATPGLLGLLAENIGPCSNYIRKKKNASCLSKCITLLKTIKPRLATLAVAYTHLIELLLELGDLTGAESSLQNARSDGLTAVDFASSSSIKQLILNRTRPSSAQPALPRNGIALLKSNSSNIPQSTSNSSSEATDSTPTPANLLVSDSNVTATNDMQSVSSEVETNPKAALPWVEKVAHVTEFCTNAQLPMTIAVSRRHSSSSSDTVNGCFLSELRPVLLLDPAMIVASAVPFLEAEQTDDDFLSHASKKIC